MVLVSKTKVVHQLTKKNYLIFSQMLTIDFITVTENETNNLS